MMIPTPPGVRLYEMIYAVVRQVPSGRVTTYGQVSKLVPGVTARMVGYAMAATPYGSGIPWQRVINAQGKISPHGEGFGTAMQHQLLVEEGVIFDSAGRIDLARFGWPDGVW
jgi:methylated-DNA-protein-cysteine methyltransferase-like protein